MQFVVGCWYNDIVAVYIFCPSYLWCFFWRLLWPWFFTWCIESYNMIFVGSGTCSNLSWVSAGFKIGRKNGRSHICGLRLGPGGLQIYGHPLKSLEEVAVIEDQTARIYEVLSQGVDVLSYCWWDVWNPKANHLGCMKNPCVFFCGINDLFLNWWSQDFWTINSIISHDWSTTPPNVTPPLQK